MLVVERVTVGSSAPVDVQSVAVEQGDFETVVSAVMGGGHGQAPLLPRINSLAVAGLKRCGLGDFGALGVARTPFEADTQVAAGDAGGDGPFLGTGGLEFRTQVQVVGAVAVGTP